MSKVGPRLTWGQRGALGCGKCRQKGCGTCYKKSVGKKDTPRTNTVESIVPDSSATPRQTQNSPRQRERSTEISSSVTGNRRSTLRDRKVENDTVVSHKNIVGGGLKPTTPLPTKKSSPRRRSPHEKRSSITRKTATIAKKKTPHNKLTLATPKIVDKSITASGPRALRPRQTGTVTTEKLTAAIKNVPAKNHLAKKKTPHNEPKLVTPKIVHKSIIASVPKTLRPRQTGTVTTEELSTAIKKLPAKNPAKKKRPHIELNLVTPKIVNKSITASVPRAPQPGALTSVKVATTNKDTPAKNLKLDIPKRANKRVKRIIQRHPDLSTAVLSATETVAGKKTKTPFSKKKRMVTPGKERRFFWRDWGATGCSKCRWKGCKTCYVDPSSAVKNSALCSLPVVSPNGSRGNPGQKRAALTTPKSDPHTRVKGRGRPKKGDFVNKRSSKKSNFQVKKAAITRNRDYALKGLLNPRKKRARQASDDWRSTDITMADKLLRKARERLLNEIKKESVITGENVRSMLPHALPMFAHRYNKKGHIGLYSPTERAAFLARYKRKKSQRVWLTGRRSAVRGRSLAAAASVDQTNNGRTAPNNMPHEYILGTTYAIIDEVAPILAGLGWETTTTAPVPAPVPSPVIPPAMAPVLASVPGLSTENNSNGKTQHYTVKASKDTGKDTNICQKEGIVQPHDHDVLSGRGRGVYNHKGNEHFRHLVSQHTRGFFASPTRQRRNFPRLIVDHIRSQDPPGRFIKQDNETKVWYAIGDEKALMKARQALHANEWSVLAIGLNVQNHMNTPSSLIFKEKR